MREVEAADASARQTQIIVAALGAVAVLGAALIAGLAGDGSTGGASAPAAQVIPPKPSRLPPTLSIGPLGVRKLQPKGIVLTVTGSVANPEPGTSVFLLGRLAVPDGLPPAPGAAHNLVSPPAKQDLDSSWRITWQLPDLDDVIGLQFTAVLARWDPETSLDPPAPTRPPPSASPGPSASALPSPSPSPSPQPTSPQPTSTLSASPRPSRSTAPSAGPSVWPSVRPGDPLPSGVVGTRSKLRNSGTSSPLVIAAVPVAVGP